MYCVSLLGYTWQCELKCFDIKLQTLDDENKILVFDKNTVGIISSVTGERLIKSDENKKVLYDDTNIYCGWAMSASQF